MPADKRALKRLSAASGAPFKGGTSLQSLNSSLAVALACLAAFALAEMFTILFSAQLGLLTHLLLLLLLFVYVAQTWRQPGCRFSASLTLVPLIRIIGYSLPLSHVPLLYWYLIASVPLFAAVLVLRPLLRLPWHQLGFNRHHWPRQLFVALAGVGLGFAEYHILKPAPLLASPKWQEIVLAALILLVCTGYLEELIFRRLIQQTAVERLGRFWGILFVAALFALFHLGYKSAANLIFAFIIGLAYGLIVEETGSILGVSLAHGLTNVTLFLVVPLLTPL